MNPLRDNFSGPILLGMQLGAEVMQLGAEVMQLGAEVDEHINTNVLWEQLGAQSLCVTLHTIRQSIWQQVLDTITNERN